jgi:hypothetical protein
MPIKTTFVMRWGALPDGRDDKDGDTRRTKYIT